MEVIMEVTHERVAGLDVHKDNVVASVRTMPDDKPTREMQTFAATTDGLLGLREWLTSCGCELVAMEATGVYWMPVWKILSDSAFKLIVVNAAHIKAVPGRKTDMNDATWLADLATFGLVKASFVPDEEQHELRALTRTRKQLVREQTRHVQRIQKTLTEANIRLDSVISDTAMSWSPSICPRRTAIRGCADRAPYRSRRRACSGAEGLGQPSCSCEMAGGAGLRAPAARRPTLIRLLSKERSDDGRARSRAGTARCWRDDSPKQ
jgi:hypothetical protein